MEAFEKELIHARPRVPRPISSSPLLRLRLVWSRDPVRPQCQALGSKWRCTGWPWVSYGKGRGPGWVTSSSIPYIHRRQGRSAREFLFRNPKSSSSGHPSIQEFTTRLLLSSTFSHRLELYGGGTTPSLAPKYLHPRTFHANGSLMWTVGGGPALAWHRTSLRRPRRLLHAGDLHFAAGTPPKPAAWKLHRSLPCRWSFLYLWGYLCHPRFTAPIRR